VRLEIGDEILVPGGGGRGVSGVGMGMGMGMGIFCGETGGWLNCEMNTHGVGEGWGLR